MQSPLATKLIEHQLTEQAPGFISSVANAETVRVLERASRVPAGEIADAIERTLQAAELVVENEPEVFTAMLALREGRGSFGDALISGLGRAAGCTHTVTFDRATLRLEGFASL